MRLNEKERKIIFKFRSEVISNSENEIKNTLVLKTGQIIINTIEDSTNKINGTVIQLIGRYKQKLFVLFVIFYWFFSFS